MSWECSGCGIIYPARPLSCDRCEAHHFRQVNNTPTVDDRLIETFGPTEADPHGRDPHEPGAKLDDGKPRVWLVLAGFPRALEEISKAGTFGAKKYSDNGWMYVPDGIARYSDAMGRHLLKEAMGEKLAPDSGLMHAAHAAWNLLATLELKLRQ